jgi:hypothetical protein
MVVFKINGPMLSQAFKKNPKKCPRRNFVDFFVFLRIGLEVVFGIVDKFYLKKLINSCKRWRKL